MIAYLINQYPQTSQSFIRREIAALEQAGVAVKRYTLRRWDVALVDPADVAEQQRTRAVLDAGAVQLLGATTKTAITRPAQFIRTLAQAIRIGWRSHRGLPAHLAYLAEACVLLQWFEQDKIAHVHAHFATNSTTVAMLCRMLGGPSYSFTIHGPEEFDKPEFLALAQKVRHAHFVAAISEFTRSQVFRWADLSDWSKVHVIRCAVDESFLAGTGTPPPDAPRLVCVGRFGETKGHPMLIRAAARLAEQGMDFELVMIGDGPLAPEIRRLIAQHNLHDRVKLLGWRSNEDVRREIQNSRALVLASFAEGLPVVFMEALALERPVITTYVAGIPELVQDGVSGWLVPAGAVEPLADAMRKALTLSPEALHRMGRAGAAVVARQHNAATESSRLAALFNGHLSKL